MNQAVIYARVSTGSQEQGLSGQIEQCMAYCDLHGIRIESTHTDEGRSGRSLKRPGLRAALDVGVDVVVWRLDRLTRSADHFEGLLGDLHNSMTSLHVAHDGYRVPGSTALARQQVVEAEAESASIAVRTAAGMARARDRGVRLGRPPVGWSIVDGHWRENDLHPLVVRAHALREAGMTLRDTVDIFNAEGVPTPSGRGSWGPSMIVRLRRSPIVAPSTHAVAIVPFGEWTEVGGVEVRHNAPQAVTIEVRPLRR